LLGGGRPRSVATGGGLHCGRERPGGWAPTVATPGSLPCRPSQGGSGACAPSFARPASETLAGGRRTVDAGTPGGALSRAPSALALWAATERRSVGLYSTRRFFSAGPARSLSLTLSERLGSEVSLCRGLRSAPLRALRLLAFARSASLPPKVLASSGRRLLVSETRTNFIVNHGPFNSKRIASDFPDTFAPSFTPAASDRRATLRAGRRSSS
jgi:hypothetical protein